MNIYTEITLSILVTLRMAMLLAYESGPFNIFGLLRTATQPKNEEGCTKCQKSQFLTCINCTSCYIFPAAFLVIYFCDSGWLFLSPLWGSMLVIVFEGIRYTFLSPIGPLGFRQNAYGNPLPQPRKNPPL